MDATMQPSHLRPIRKFGQGFARKGRKYGVVFGGLGFCRTMARKGRKGGKSPPQGPQRAQKAEKRPQRGGPARNFRILELCHLKREPRNTKGKFWKCTLSIGSSGRVQSDVTQRKRRGEHTISTLVPLQALPVLGGNKHRKKGPGALTRA